MEAFFGEPTQVEIYHYNPKFLKIIYSSRSIEGGTERGIDTANSAEQLKRHKVLGMESSWNGIVQILLGNGLLNLPGLAFLKVPSLVATT